MILYIYGWILYGVCRGLDVPGRCGGGGSGVYRWVNLCVILVCDWCVYLEVWPNHAAGPAPRGPEVGHHKLTPGVLKDVVPVLL